MHFYSDWYLIMDRKYTSNSNNGNIYNNDSGSWGYCSMTTSSSCYSEHTSDMDGDVSIINMGEHYYISKQN